MYIRGCSAELHIVLIGLVAAPVLDRHGIGLYYESLSSLHFFPAPMNREWKVCRNSLSLLTIPLQDPSLTPTRTKASFTPNPKYHWIGLR